MTYKLTEENKKIREMFSAISGRYDFLNHLLSMNIDKSWRKKTVNLMDLNTDRTVLDLATGTGDVAIEIMRQSQKKLDVVGVDFTQDMLKVAVVKTKEKKDTATFKFVNAPAESLPLKDDLFDYCTIAFGIRNFVDKKLALKEIVRVLKPGGKVLILEFSRPKNPLFNSVYSFYFFKVLPKVAGMFSRQSAYTYLPDSVSRFPSDKDFSEMMLKAGFKKVTIKPLTLGISSIYLGEA